MTVKQGYKLTEVGVIPEDWEVALTQDVLVFQGGSQPEKSYFSQFKKFGFIRLIQIRDYKTDKFETYIPQKLARRFCSEDDIMIGRYGPPIFQILKGIEGAYNVALIKAKPQQNIQSTFAYYFLKQEKLFRFIENLSKRSSGQTGIDLHELKKYPLGLPSLPEQTAIANALSDADAYINSLELLIAKKQQIKQGTMQELLTGKKRLEGFSGEWEEKKLGDIFSFHGGYSASRNDLGHDGFCYLHYGDIHTTNKSIFSTKTDFQDIPKINISLSQITNTSLLKHGDVVFVDASEDEEGVNKYVVIENQTELPYISGLHTIVAKQNNINTLDFNFKRYCFQSLPIKKQFRFYAVGTKVLGISKTHISKIVLNIPPIEEQTAIANILTNMDNEIQELQNKLTKAKHIKQGMMQELLTGKTRLI